MSCYFNTRSSRKYQSVPYFPTEALDDFIADEKLIKDLKKTVIWLVLLDLILVFVAAWLFFQSHPAPVPFYPCATKPIAASVLG